MLLDRVLAARELPGKDLQHQGLLPHAGLDIHVVYIKSNALKMLLFVFGYKLQKMSAISKLENDRNAQFISLA